MAITHPPPTGPTDDGPARGFENKILAVACERRRALSFFRRASPCRDASATSVARVLMLRVVS